MDVSYMEVEEENGPGDRARECVGEGEGEAAGSQHAMEAEVAATEPGAQDGQETAAGPATDGGDFAMVSSALASGTKQLDQELKAHVQRATDRIK